MGFLKNLFSIPDDKRKKGPQTKFKTPSVYDVYKEAHREIILVDQHGSKFSIPWKDPFVITVNEYIDDETIRRFQFFVSRIKQNSIDEYFFTGYSFLSQQERSFFLRGTCDEDNAIIYNGNAFSPKHFFYFLKELNFQK